MVVGVQRTGDISIGAYTWYSGDDLDTKAICPSQWKMVKRQRTGIRLMATGTWHVDFGPRAKTNSYLKQPCQMGKSLITASTKLTNFGRIAMSQWMAKPRVIVEQQTNTYPQVISVQQTDSSLMVMLQWMAMLRVVINRRAYLTLETTRTQ